jgi:aminomuconate-semialdehyde/2-hydroxymuconate-6-semialdehyde dehydrogenase
MMAEVRQIKNFIAGEYRVSASTFKLADPATNELTAIVHEASAVDVADAVAAANESLRGEWGRMSAADRHELMRKACDLILARKEEFIAAEIGDSGHPVNALSNIEIPRGAQQLRVFADIASQQDEPETFETNTPDGRTANNYTQRVPKGVIAAICPWNLPLIMATWKLAPALAWGNTIVLKPSEETPSTATMLGEIFNEAGIPPGVLNVVNGFGPNSTGEFLTTHADIDAINFTGETATGTAIMQAAAVGIRDVSLELGGKNAAIILHDCDLDAAVAGAAASVFYNCGQICLGTERIYVHRSLFDEFVQKLKLKAEQQVLGDPRSTQTTLGPLVSQGHRDKVLQCFRQAESDGAEVITGGGTPEMEGRLAEGAWVQPTIWTGMSEGSVSVKEEIFGPCCHVAPFDDDEEAVALANDTRYGLAATIWSTDTRRARATAEKLKAGVCWINGWMIRDLRTAFGGFGQSGIGREGGVHAKEFHTELKNICQIVDSPAV